MGDSNTASPPTSEFRQVPRRDYGSTLGNPRLAKSLPIVGLGCSSFSHFFWTDREQADWQATSEESFSIDSLTPDHPRVQEWIETVRFAVCDCGITLLDTAPWYGHGTSEVVLGWAITQLVQQHGVNRQDMTIQTKVGRYEADPSKQFDFSYDTTISAVQRSLQRLQVDYIDVLQLHDPEFAPSLDQLMQETIPALLECQRKGWCRALGMTGYPLSVQHQILQRSMQVFGTNVWDQALTYGHFNLHDTSLCYHPLGNDKSSSNGDNSVSSFAEYCQCENMGLLAAAPFSMGLLTHRTIPSWHPASSDLAAACQQAATTCQKHQVDISHLALIFACAHPQIPCTIVGCQNVAEVQTAARLACRLAKPTPTPSKSTMKAQHDDRVQHILTETERQVYQLLLNAKNGPFAKVWMENSFQWDGVQAARDFYTTLSGDVPSWQTPDCKVWDRLPKQE